MREILVNTKVNNLKGKDKVAPVPHQGFGVAVQTGPGVQEPVSPRGPPEPSAEGKRRQQGSMGSSGSSSGVFSFADIVGRDVALLPVGFCQPPLCISHNVFKLQDLQSLVG